MPVQIRIYLQKYLYVKVNTITIPPAPSSISEISLIALPRLVTALDYSKGQNIGLFRRLDILVI